MAAQERYSFDTNSVHYHNNAELGTINNLAQRFSFDLKKQPNVQYIITINNTLQNEPNIGNRKHMHLKDNLTSITPQQQNNKTQENNNGAFVNKLQDKNLNKKTQSNKNLKKELIKKYSKDDSLIMQNTNTIYSNLLNLNSHNNSKNKQKGI
jgi:hypothetical protein